MNAGWFDFADLAQCIYIQSISGIMLFLWLLDCLINGNLEVKKSNLYVPILCILLWSGLSFFWATNRAESFDLLTQWVACGIIFFSIYNMVKTNIDVTIIMGAMMTSMSYLMVIGLIQYCQPTFNLYVQAVAPSATFANKNMFCDYLIIVLPLCFYFFMNDSNKSSLYPKIISGLIFVSGIQFIIISKTRAEMLSFPILLFMLLIGLIILGKINKNLKEIFSKQKVVLIIIFTSLFILVLTSFFLFAP